MSQFGDSLNDFGLLIAYVIPGLVFLYGSSYAVPELQVWFTLNELNNMSFASVVLLAVMAVGSGLIVHTLRWLLLDSFHHVTGVRPKKWDFTKLNANLATYDALTENHYRYHQFYGGMVIALVWSLLSRSSSLNIWIDPLNMATVMLIALMSWGSRDTISKYYSRLDAILTQASIST